MLVHEALIELYGYETVNSLYDEAYLSYESSLNNSPTFNLSIFNKVLESKNINKLSKSDLSKYKCLSRVIFKSEV